MKLKKNLSSLVIAAVLALSIFAPAVINPVEVNGSSKIIFHDYAWPADDFDYLMCVKQLPGLYLGASKSSWLHVGPAGEHSRMKVRIRADGYSGNRRDGYVTVRYKGGTIKYDITEYGMTHK